MKGQLWKLIHTPWTKGNQSIKMRKASVGNKKQIMSHVSLSKRLPFLISA
jgi:hypothetical protein